MGLESVKYLVEFGIIGAALIFMLWASHKREVKLMGFMDGMGKDMTRITKALTSLENKFERMDREQRAQRECRGREKCKND